MRDWWKRFWIGCAVGLVAGSIGAAVVFAILGSLGIFW